MALDGNASGGLLLEIFAVEMTSAEATCASCGVVGPSQKPRFTSGAGNCRPLPQMYQRAYGHRAGPQAELHGSERPGRAGNEPRR
jgi:hypothetical protein